MSFQRPSSSTSTSGPSTASYSEFLKDIYSGLRALSTGVAAINTRLDTFTQQLQSFDARLERQDQMSQTLAARIDTLIQQRENSQIRQTTSGLSLLSELDTLGSRQVEPSTGLAELGLWTDKLISSSSLLSKLSFQLPGIPELQHSQLESSNPDITIHEPSPTNYHATPTNIISIGNQFNEPSTTTPTPTPTTATATTNVNTGINSEPVYTNQQLGTNFLILD